MNPNMPQFVLNHIGVTLLVVFLSLLVGGGVGIGIAYLLKFLYRTAPKLRVPLKLLPWRTFILGLALFFFSPVAYYLFKVKMIPLVFPFLMAFGFILLSLAFTIEKALETWYPEGLAIRLVSLGRTLAVGCGVALSIAGQSVNWGILNYATKIFFTRFQTSDFGWAFLTVLILGFIFDLLLGILQMLLAFSKQKKNSAIPSNP